MNNGVKMRCARRFKVADNISREGSKVLHNWSHIRASMLAGTLCSRTLHPYIQLAPYWIIRINDFPFPDMAIKRLSYNPKAKSFMVNTNRTPELEPQSNDDENTKTCILLSKLQAFVRYDAEDTSANVQLCSV
ncbi:hypothetical protein TNCV_3563551 [Trichonephila clavipes]|nr:hypothetical protein TNCV_3563551 [Trichonephila clavipes]